MPVHLFNLSVVEVVFDHVDGVLSVQSDVANAKVTQVACILRRSARGSTISSSLAYTWQGLSRTRYAQCAHLDQVVFFAGVVL